MSEDTTDTGPMPDSAGFVPPRPHPSASKTGHVRASTVMRKYQDEERVNDLRSVLQSDEGKRFILRLLDESRALVDPFNRDSLQMAHDVGMQALGRTLIAWLGQADPAAFPRLLLQRLENQRRADEVRQTLIAQESSKR